MAGQELSEKEQWNHFRNLTYTLLDPQRDRTIVQQIHEGHITELQWESLGEMISKTFYSPGIEDLSSRRSSQLDPNLKMRIRAKLMDRIERTTTLVQAAESFSTAPDKIQVIAPPTPQPNKDFELFIFRIRGRRFGIPAFQVQSTGRVEATSLLSRNVNTRFGKIPLKDIKRTLGISGEAGQVYILTQTAQSPLKIAWAVDGLEGKKAWKENPLQSLPTMGSSSLSRSLFSGLVRDDVSPILVLDLDQMISRATFRSL